MSGDPAPRLLAAIVESTDKGGLCRQLRISSGDLHGMILLSCKKQKRDKCILQGYSGDGFEIGRPTAGGKSWNHLALVRKTQGKPQGNSRGIHVALNASFLLSVTNGPHIGL